MHALGLTCDAEQRRGRRKKGMNLRRIRSGARGKLQEKTGMKSKAPTEFWREASIDGRKPPARWYDCCRSAPAFRSSAGGAVLPAASRCDRGRSRPGKFSEHA